MHNNVLILGIGLILVGFVVCYYGAVKLLKGWQSLHHWSTVNGKVIGLDAMMVNPLEGKPERSKYKISIQYEFVVDNTTYLGHRIAFDEEYKNKSFTQLEHIKSKYKVGQHVPINYNPNNPADSVLQVGINWWDVQYPLTGVVMMVLGLLVLVT